MPKPTSSILGTLARLPFRLLGIALWALVFLGIAFIGAAFAIVSPPRKSSRSSGGNRGPGRLD
jgi:hypothetical protein